MLGGTAAQTALAARPRAAAAPPPLPILLLFILVPGLWLRATASPSPSAAAAAANATAGGAANDADADANDCAGEAALACGAGELKPFFWIMGCVACALSALFSIVGMIFMKLAFKKMEAKPAGERKTICGLPMSSTWWLGFFLLVILPLPSDFLALGLASASLTFPVGVCVTVICSQVVAPRLLDGEKLTRRDWIASFVICLGCVFTTAFGDQEARSYTGDQILGLYLQPAFIAVFSIMLMMMIAALAVIHCIGDRLRAAHRFAAAVYVPAFMVGVQTISFKSMSEMTTNTALGEGNEWATFPPWFFVGLTVFIAIFQLKYMNEGAANFKATVFMPAFNASLMVCVVVNGAIFFQEWRSIHPAGFSVGVILILSGITVLAWDDPTDPREGDTGTAKVGVDPAADSGSGAADAENDGNNNAADTAGDNAQHLAPQPLSPGAKRTPASASGTPHFVRVPVAVSPELTISAASAVEAEHPPELHATREDLQERFAGLPKIDRQAALRIYHQRTIVNKTNAPGGGGGGGGGGGDVEKAAIAAAQAPSPSVELLDPANVKERTVLMGVSKSDDPPPAAGSGAALMGAGLRSTERLTGVKLPSKDGEN